MANVELARDDAEGEAVARLLDPIALEARLADARARRAAVLAAKAEAELLPPPVNLPGLALRGAGVILTGLGIVVAAVGFLLGGPGPAPDIALIAAIPSPPGAVPAVQRPGAAGGWAASSSAPRLAGLVFAPPAAPNEAWPPSRPVRTAAAAVVPSKTRAARSPAMATVTPVLARAFASTLQPMVSRSAALLPYPLAQDDRRGTLRATPTVVRRPQGLVEQITRASRSAVRGVTRSDPGGEVARTIRRAVSFLDNGSKGQSRGHASPAPRGIAVADSGRGGPKAGNVSKGKGGSGQRAHGQSGGPKGIGGSKGRGEAKGQRGGKGGGSGKGGGKGGGDDKGGGGKGGGGKGGSGKGGGGKGGGGKGGKH